MLVDVTERVVEVCRERFTEATYIDYVLTEGATLPGVADASVDFVWSFDAFVHIAPLNIASYLAEIAPVLKPRGRAVIHHSGRFQRGPGWRSPMTAALLTRLAEEPAQRGAAVRLLGRRTFRREYEQDVITVLEPGE